MRESAQATTSAALTRRIAVLACVVAPAVLGCGAGRTSLTGTGLSPSRNLSLIPTPSPAGTPTPATPAEATTSEAAAACTDSQLTLAYLDVGAAAGNVRVDIAIRNEGPDPCTLQGWPTLQLVSVTGGTLPTHVTDTTSTFFGSATTQLVTLGIGTPPLNAQRPAQGYAYISVAGNDVLNSCATAGGAYVTLPGTAGPVLVDFGQGTASEGLTFCSSGSLQVLPVTSTLATSP